MTASELLIPPAYCQYAAGACDQDFSDLQTHRAFVAYASEPTQIANTIENAVQIIGSGSTTSIETWKHIPSAGRILFCEICKRLRCADVVIADVTTLSFNVLFELGFALGLNKPVIPLRDTSYMRDRRAFDELGILDTFGYVDFVNSTELAERLPRDLAKASALGPVESRVLVESPVYVLKGPLNTDGALQLMGTMKKTGIRFRTYDADETPRLALGEARRQVASSVAVVAHLLSPNREGALVHNSLCALIAGMAMAQQKIVVMLQEEFVPQPLDYRDVVIPYKVANQIPRLLEASLRKIIDVLQDTKDRPPRPGRKLLQVVDLGDVAAENEIQNLGQYFVETGQFIQASQGHARLITGRKGSGKTAIFYEVRRAVRNRRPTVVLDLRPEGHQFTRIREVLESRLSAGMREHTVTALWNYILLGELARRLLEQDRNVALRDARRADQYRRLESVYERHDPGWDADFPQRLKRQVDRISAAAEQQYSARPDDTLTELIFLGDFRELSEAVLEYLAAEKDSVVILVDNLDKGWPVRGAHDIDILIVRGLLESTRKLQHQLRESELEFKCLVFLRNDIYEQLLRATPDKGKDTVIRLDWDDPAVFREIIRLRMLSGLDGDTERTFEDVWANFFVSHVGAQDCFDYILERTLMRPRDVLQFVHRCIEVAINRGHDVVSEDDVQSAEHLFSEELLVTTAYEMQDTRGDMAAVLYSFQAMSAELDDDDVRLILMEAGVESESVDDVVELLLWYGFLGVRSNVFTGDRFAYQIQYNLRRLLAPVEQRNGKFVIHPGFRSALDAWLPGTTEARNAVE